MSPSPPWPPTRFCEPLESFATSTGVARVRTDAGDVFVKALGNKEGPPALVRDYIGTRLAEWFGLPVFEYALMPVGLDDDIPLGHGLKALPGTAFVTRAYQRAIEWSGGDDELELLLNPQDITKLVAFDTWLLNPDRYRPRGSSWNPNYDNVFLARQDDAPGRVRLIAMDFSVCLYLEQRTELTTEIGHICRVQDDRVYGLYPAFEQRLDGAALLAAVRRLGELERQTVEEIVMAVPRDWEVPKEVRMAVAGFVLQRAAFVARTLPETLRPYVERQGDLLGRSE